MVSMHIPVTNNICIYTKQPSYGNKCVAPKSLGEKRYEIKSGSQEMAVMIVQWQILKTIIQVNLWVLQVSLGLDISLRFSFVFAYFFHIMAVFVLISLLSVIAYFYLLFSLLQEWHSFVDNFNLFSIPWIISKVLKI